VANAFNLTDNPSGEVIGFSGTKDNSLLLPLHVKPSNPKVDEMAATDGKMLELVLHARVECQPPESQSTSLAEYVLDLAVKNGSSALIDPGATMAGLTNSEVAECILKLLPIQTPIFPVSCSSISNPTRGMYWHVTAARQRTAAPRFTRRMPSSSLMRAVVVART
jgi:hypothetical protein